MFTIRHYSKALFELALQEKKQDRFLLDLELVSETLKKEKEMKKFFLDPEISFEKKRETLKSIFGPKVSLMIYNLLFLLIKKNNLKLLPHIFYDFKKRIYETKNVQEVEITSALPIASLLKNEIKRLLERKLAKEIEIIERLDPKCIGGIVVKVGDTLFDLSLKRRIELLKADLI